MIIGIIAAMKPEVENIIKSLQNKIEHNISNVTIYEGNIAEHKVYVSLSESLILSKILYF